MSDKPKMIRFIDSDYKELFQIPDGGKIKITYPPGDERGTTVRACKFMDDHHFRLFADEMTTTSFGSVFHICEFAENMERMGVKYEPDTQLQNVELKAFTKGEEKFYTYNREEGNSCVGHIAGDFGGDGERFNSNWASRENGKNTLEFQSELHSAIYGLRHDLLKDYDSMAAYCQAHPEALLDGGESYKQYGFKLETDTRQYYTQCFVDESMRDSRFIIYAYENPAPALEQSQPVFELFHARAKVNDECAKSIDTAIKACNYEQYRYKMSDAVKAVVDNFGFECVNWVLASTIHQRLFDGRFSTSNQKWARDFDIPKERYAGFSVQTHLAVLDGFIDSVRKAHVEMLAESVGSYEKSHNMADRNRLTWFHNDFGVFVPKEGVTEQRLSERHNEITEKKSVLAQIRADRKAQKQSSAPKPERNTKKQGPEL